jgi:hypothetical protein
LRLLRGPHLDAELVIGKRGEGGKQTGKGREEGDERERKE